MFSNSKRTKVNNIESSNPICFSYTITTTFGRRRAQCLTGLALCLLLLRWCVFLCFVIFVMIISTAGAPVVLTVSFPTHSHPLVKSGREPVYLLCIRPSVQSRSNSINLLKPIRCRGTLHSLATDCLVTIWNQMFD